MTTVIAPCPDPYTAPRDAEEFERGDGPRVRAFAASQLDGFRPQDRDDAAAEIWEKLVTNQVWLQYESDHISEHTDQPVTWKYFVNKKVTLYVRGKREQLARNTTREPLLMDGRVGDGTSSWGEVFGTGTMDSYPSLAGDDSFEALRDYLALHPAAPAPCSLLELLDEMHDRLRAGESISRLAVARRFGIAQSEAAGVIAELKGALREAVSAVPEIHRFTLGGVDLTAADIRTAADRLRRTRGNRVLPAWEGHPLEAGDPQWYIRFARAELKARPELRIPKGTHQTGHNSQVKVALLAGLERLLTELGAPEPEPEVTTEEKIQAALWQLRLPALDAGTVDLIVSAVMEVLPACP